VVHFINREKNLSQVTLALFPVGTANDFARKILCGSWKKWVKTLSQGSVVKTFDVGQLMYDSKSRAFINNAGFGRTQEALLRKKSRPIKDILDFTEKRLQIEWGREKIHQYETFRALMGIVFNSPFFNKGMYFSKDIRPDDGLLNVFIVPPQSKTSMVLKFLKTKFGGSLKSDSDVRLDASFINIDSEETLYPQVDGETVTEEGATRLKFSILKDPLNLLVPEKE